MAFRAPLAIICLLLVIVTARADLGQKEIRKLVAHVAGAQLPTSDVHVLGLSQNGTTAQAIAEVETAFRMVQNEQGQWRVIEVRTGQDRWEDTGLIAAALKTTVPVGDCDGSQLRDRGGAEPGNRRARCIIAAMLGVPLPSDDVRIKDVSQLGIPLASASSAIVVARVRLELRLENDRGSWRISAVRSGSGDWVGIDNLPGALDEAKRSRAGEELAALARALEKYRSDRGFYVSSDKEPILIDHLSPRYLSRVIRVDPWHNPYLYQGERDRFELRSSGPDGKENTQDDIVVSGPSR